MASFNTIDLGADRGVVTLTLNRPQRRNSITHEMMTEIGRAVTLVAADPAARILVLRGAGGHFSAGGDLTAMADPPPPRPDGSDPTLAAYRSFGDVLEALYRLPQAVVAVVEGSCVGGGFGMVASADLVLAAGNARFGLPEPRHGFIPSQIIPAIVRRIGLGATRRIAVTASVIDAEEAHRLGVVDRLVSPGEVDAALATQVEQLRHNAPAAVAAVKSLVRAAGEQPTAAVLDLGARSLMDLLRGDEAREGIAAFLAKRPPRWAE